MKWIKFKKFFHPSWHSKIKVFIESEDCDEIYKFLKAESKAGVQIAPASINVYKAFFETDLNNLNVVLIGESPFSMFKDNESMADGLLFGCSILNRLHPFLNKFYTALEKDFYDGFNLNYVKNKDVTYLCKQGVLMLNASLTTEKNKPGSHLNIWESFMKFLFEEIINVTGVPVIFLGKNSKNLIKYRNKNSHNFTIDYPENNLNAWNVNNTFSDVNKLLEKNNGFPVVQWLDIDVPY